MKAIFIHDHKFKTNLEKGTYYSTGTLSSDFWQRYLNVFESLTIVGRNDGEINFDVNGITLSSKEGVDFRLLPNISNLKDELFGNMLVIKECEELVASHDALIVRLPSKLGLFFIKEALRQKKPYAVEVVSSAWDALWNYGSIKSKLYAPVMELSTKQAVYNAPYAIYVTEFFLQKRYPCKIGKTSFCSNVEIDEVNSDVLTKRLRKINNHSNKTVFGLIGHYSADYKGIDVAIRALASISPHLKNWELQIVGSGDATKYINLAKSLKVNNHINFIGTLPSGEPIYDWLDSVDIYLQPSLVEGLPRALVEAMSRGCPALGSTVGGIPELLSEEQISKPSNVNNLAKNILRIVNDKEMTLKLAENNFNKASFYYKSELAKRRAEFWKSFYNYVLEHKNLS